MTKKTSSQCNLILIKQKHTKQKLINDAKIIDLGFDKRYKWILYPLCLWTNLEFFACSSANKTKTQKKSWNKTRIITNQWQNKKTKKMEERENQKISTSKTKRDLGDDSTSNSESNEERPVTIPLSLEENWPWIEFSPTSHFFLSFFFSLLFS